MPSSGSRRDVSHSRPCSLLIYDQFASENDEHFFLSTRPLVVVVLFSLFSLPLPPYRDSAHPADAHVDRDVAELFGAVRFFEGAEPVLERFCF